MHRLAWPSITWGPKHLRVLTIKGFPPFTHPGVLDDLKGVIDKLRGQSAKFGSNLSVVETRQDFTKNLINTLQTGSDNLVLADTNEEGANLLALQTRQSLSTTALSLSAQASQAVPKLLG